MLFLASTLWVTGVAGNETVGRALPLESVRWHDESFWGRRSSAMLAGLNSTMTPLMLGSDRSQFVVNFQIAAGKKAGKHRGPAWNDGDCYKWIEALSAFYAQTNDERIRSLLSEVIGEIADAQRSDGYIHTPTLIDQRNNVTGTAELGDPANFEMYNMGHLMTAGCVHFEATGDRSLLSIACRAADYLDRRFANPDIKIARHAICPAHYMGAVDLYRTTGDLKYLELCQRWLLMRDLVNGGGDDNQDRIPFLQQREAVGHAVRANYLYAGVTDLFLETKQSALLVPLNACWDSVHQRKLYVTGGCGALYDGASPDGSDKQSTITRIHQAYGRNYQLPNSTAHNETCAAIGNVLWNHRLWLSQGHAKYIDALETSLYNAVLAGVSLDGERFFYTNTLRQLDQMPTALRWPRERQSWISCYCCPPNVARTIAQVGRYAYSIDKNRTSVLLYGSNSLKHKLTEGQTIEVKQTSNYPNGGTVLLEVVTAPEHAYTISLRIPGWCSRSAVKVNSTPMAELPTAGSMFDISRQWQAGDRIELQLQMPIQLLEAHPLVEECRGQVAVRRGPLVYCLESSDLPSGASIQNIFIDPKQVTNWTVHLQANAEPLANIPVLKGKVQLGHVQLGNDGTLSPSVSEPLYHNFETRQFTTTEVQLVPYFAWGNRGRSEMSVWIPVKQ